MLLSTHLLDQAQKLCTRVGILYKGRLAACGSLDDLLAGAGAGAALEDIFFAVTAPNAPNPTAPPDALATAEDNRE